MAAPGCNNMHWHATQHTWAGHAILVVGPGRPVVLQLVLAWPAHENHPARFFPVALHVVPFLSVLIQCDASTLEPAVHHGSSTCKYPMHLQAKYSLKPTYSGLLDADVSSISGSVDLHLQQRMQQARQRQVHQHHIEGPLNIALVLQTLCVLQVQAAPRR